MSKAVREQFGDNAWVCEVCNDWTPPGWTLCGVCEEDGAKIAEAMLAARKEEK